VCFQDRHDLRHRANMLDEVAMADLADLAAAGAIQIGEFVRSERNSESLFVVIVQGPPILD
jgi:hypothetical protein